MTRHTDRQERTVKRSTCFFCVRERQPARPSQLPTYRPSQLPTTAACLLLRAYSCRGLCMYARTDCRERHARRRQAQRCSSSATSLCLSPCRMVGTHGLSGRNILGFRHAKGEQLRRRRHAPRRRHVLERDPVFVPQHFLHLISRQAHFTHRHTHARRETRAKTTT